MCSGKTSQLFGIGKWMRQISECKCGLETGECFQKNGRALINKPPLSPIFVSNGSSKYLFPHKCVRQLDRLADWQLNEVKIVVKCFNRFPIPKL